MLLAVLRLLLDEQVSIRNLPLILEAIAEARGRNATPEGDLRACTPAAGLPAGRRNAPRPTGRSRWSSSPRNGKTPLPPTRSSGDRGGGDVALPPEEFNRLAGGDRDKIDQAAGEGTYPALVTSTRRRRFLRTVLSAKGIPNPVLSFEEIGIEARPALVGLVPA